MPWDEKTREYLLEDRVNFRRYYCGRFTWEGLEYKAPPEDHIADAHIETARKILNEFAKAAPNADHASPGWGNLEPVAILAVVSTINGKFDKVRLPPENPKCRSLIGLCYREKKFWLVANERFLKLAEVKESEQWERYDINNNEDPIRRYTGSSIIIDVDSNGLVDVHTNGDLNLKHFLSKFNRECADELIYEMNRSSFLKRISPRFCEFGLEPSGTVFPKIVDKGRRPMETVDLAVPKDRGDIIKVNTNTILYGPPGTGKTFATLGLALSIIQPDDKVKSYAHSILSEGYAKTLNEEMWREWLTKYDTAVSAGQVVFTTFHQNYSYEDFVEGIRARVSPEEKRVFYEIEAGIFKKTAYRALYAWLTGKACPTDEEQEKEAFAHVLSYLRASDYTWSEDGQHYPNPEGGNINYIIIIDELNRGNISRILGELITLLEPSKRVKLTGAMPGDQPLKVTLPYSRDPFIVPPNLFILGTMNTADRSLIGLDVALRRRFSFVELLPQPSALEGLPADVKFLKDFLIELNERIEERLDSDHLIGHAFFLGVKNLEELADAMREKVIPQLREYFHGRPEDLRFVLGRKSERNECDFLEFDGGVERKRLRLKKINQRNLITEESYLSFIGQGA